MDHVDHMDHMALLAVPKKNGVDVPHIPTYHAPCSMASWGDFPAMKDTI